MILFFPFPIQWRCVQPLSRAEKVFIECSGLVCFYTGDAVWSQGSQRRFEALAGGELNNDAWPQCSIVIHFYAGFDISPATLCTQ